MNTQPNSLQWGFYSRDGFFQPVSSLTVNSLEYVGKSFTELQYLLRKNIVLEQYEKCAVIRDEIGKRMNSERT